jgi:hypothetical protein
MINVNWMDEMQFEGLSDVFITTLVGLFFNYTIQLQVNLGQSQNIKMNDNVNWIDEMQFKGLSDVFYYNFGWNFFNYTIQL